MISYIVWCFPFCFVSKTVCDLNWFRNSLMETPLVKTIDLLRFFTYCSHVPFLVLRNPCQIKIGKILWFSLISRVIALCGLVAATYSSCSSSPTFQELSKRLWYLLIRPGCLVLWSSARTSGSIFKSVKRISDK